MNRGQLEKIAVQLYMLAIRNRMAKGEKPEQLRRIKIEVTRWSEFYLSSFIMQQVDHLEVM